MAKQANGKKITLATVKAFIRKNFDQLYIKVESKFDGMTGMVEQDYSAAFKPIIPADNGKAEEIGNNWAQEWNQGIQGAWFVGSSRDYFQPFDEGGFKGFKIYNCCGSFVLAVKEA